MREEHIGTPPPFGHTPPASEDEHGSTCPSSEEEHIGVPSPFEEEQSSTFSESCSPMNVAVPLTSEEIVAYLWEGASNETGNTYYNVAYPLNLGIH